GDAAGKTGEFTASLARVLTANEGSLDGVFGDTRTVLDRIVADKSVLAKALQTLPWTTSGMIRFTSSGDWINAYVRGAGVIDAYLVGGMKIFHRSYSIKAEFSDASDVGPGDPVRVAGIDVGKVSSIKRQPHSIMMALQINKGVKLSQGISASVRLRTLLGKKFIDIADPGAGPDIAAGAVVPETRTKPATDVDQVITAFRGSVQRTDVAAINNVMQEFDKVMAGR